MKELIVVKHDTYGSGLTLATATFDNLASLAAGAICVFNTDSNDANYGKAVDLAKAAPDAVPAQFTIAWNAGSALNAQGVLTADIRQSQNVIKATGTMLKSIYVAPVAKQIILGKTTSGDVVKTLVLPVMSTLPSVGGVAGVRIKDLSKNPYQTNGWKPYLIQVTSVDTEATIAAALIALINADAKAIVTAAIGYAGSTTSVLFTGKNALVNFDVSKEGILRDSYVTTMVQANCGEGVAKDVVEIEKTTTVEDGQWDAIPGGLAAGIHNFKFPSQVDLTKSYHLYILKFTNPSQRQPILGTQGVENQIILAVDTSLTAAATLNTMNGIGTLDAAF